MIKQDEIIEYLINKGFISSESIVDGEITLVDASQRNSNLKITNTLGQSYFIKVGRDREKFSALAHEAYIYNYLCQNLTNFQSYLTNLVYYDPESSIIILDLLQEAENFKEYCVNKELRSAEYSVLLGTALSSLHSLKCLDNYELGSQNSLSTRIPWILSVHRPSLGLFAHSSRANIEVIKIIQNFTNFCDELDALRLDWKQNTLIHFDIRWGNILVVPSNFDNNKINLKLVDWELACIGDPCWDIGSVFQEYLSTWVHSIPVASGIPQNQLPDLAQSPLEEMQPSIRNFWKTYISQMNFDSKTSEIYLIKSLKLAAARLIVTVYEEMQQATSLTGTAISLLQLSYNILCKPMEAANYLLGIYLEEAKQ